MRAEDRGFNATAVGESFGRRGPAC